MCRRRPRTVRARGSAASSRWATDSSPARAARVVVPQPLIAVPGLPPPLAIVDGNGNGQLDAGEVRRPGGGRVGLRTSAASQARNLAVPGEDVTSVLEGLDGGAVAERLQMGQDV